MTTITLNTLSDVTPQVKQDLLNNNLDKLIINFDTNSKSGIPVIFDKAQETIDFDIEVNSRSANDLFLNLKNLSSIKKSLDLRKVKTADNLFKGCENLFSFPKLHFDRHSYISIDKYHCFCDYDVVKECGLSGIRESYLVNELNLYPSWYFRSAISGNVFNFRIFFDEIFKFIFSYRGLGLDSWSSPFFKCKIHKTDWLFESVKDATDSKSCCFDLDKINYSHPVKFSSDLFGCFLRNFTACYVHDVFKTFHRFDDYFSTDLFDMCPMFHFVHNLYEQFYLNGFTIEFSKEKIYFKTGTHKISDVIDEGKDLLKKHSGDGRLTDIIHKILDALKNKGKETPDPDAKVITYDEIAEKSLRDLDEIIGLNHRVPIEESDRHSDTDSDDNSDESDEKHHDNRDKASHVITESLYDIDLSVLDDLPDDLPPDIKDWIDKVKDIEVWKVMLGCFMPGACPLKIVMYTETIKEVAGNAGISHLHLFEATLAHEFFHAMHFVMCFLEKFSDISLLADICDDIRATMGSKGLSEKNAYREIWLQLQKETLKHWYPVNGKDITCQVLEPLAVAFEISWVKDRIITQRHNIKWQKIMKYELSRFGGLGSYPSDPYCGAKYLISCRKNRRKLADMETVNTNISAVLQRSLDSMRSAYVLIRNSLAW